MKAPQMFNLLTLSLICWVPIAQAECSATKSVDLNIPSQPIQSALVQLAAQCELTLLVRLSDIQNLYSQPLDGHYVVEAALQRLLESSGLTGTISRQGFIKISHSSPTHEEEKTKQFILPSTATEEVVVSGLRHSFYSSAEHKQNADVIEDVITEYNIAQMPDKSVAESLQRLPGVTTEKRIGEGTKVNVRGFDQNLILYNGETFLSGMEYYQLGWDDQNYDGSLETIPVEALNRINVYKSFRATDIEGSVGGTIDLLSRNPFDIDDVIFAAEVGVDSGKYSRKEQPAGVFTFGKNWNDNFAGVVTVSSTERTVHADYAESYIDGALLYEVKDRDNQILIPPHLVPQYSYVSDIEQNRKLTSINLNLAYKPSSAVDVFLDIMSLGNSIYRRDYQIWHAIQYTDADNYQLNNDYDIPFIEKGVYQKFPQEFSTLAENARSTAHNAFLKLNVELSDNLTVNNTLGYATARYDEQLGNRDLFYAGEPSFAPVWVGTGEYVTPDGQSRTSETGWTSYYNLCARCQESSLQAVDYNNSSFTLAEYENKDFFSDPYNAIASASRANGAETDQVSWTLRSDFVWRSDSASESEFTFGFRLARRDLDYKNYRYLTNFAETKGAAAATQFDNNGEILKSSEYDPARPADEYNVGIKDAYYYDLCNNGGIVASNTCDIDGDGIDDNLPYGPWSYDVDASNPLLANSRYTSADRLYSALLYGPQLENTIFPAGHVPWQTYAANPGIYKKIKNFLPSHTYSNDIYFSDADLISKNIAQWIDQVTPYSPTKRFYIPRTTYSVTQNTQAIYGEYNYHGDEWPLTINTGFRLVQTDTEIIYNEINNARKISLTDQDWQISGIGNGWSEAKQHSQYFNVLPSTNFIWDFSNNNKLRLSAGKSIAHPDFQLLGKGFSPRYIDERYTTEDNVTKYRAIATGGTAGNPSLKPEEITQGDISFERYYGISNYVQLALFYKHISGQIIEGLRPVELPDESENGFTLVNIESPANTRTSHVKGLEVALQNAWLSGFGISANYAYLDSYSDLTSHSSNRYGIPGTSKHMANTAGFFESSVFSVRLVYNWRSEYVSPYRTSTQARNRTSSNDDEPILVKSYLPYGQWDARVLWHLQDNMTLTLDAINITETVSSSYLEYKHNINSNELAEPRYILGFMLSL